MSIIDKVRYNLNLIRRWLGFSLLSYEREPVSCIDRVFRFGYHLGGARDLVKKGQYEEARGAILGAHEALSAISAVCPFPDVDVMSVREYLDDAIRKSDEGKWDDVSYDLAMAEFLFSKMLEKLAVHRGV
jgi:hypothetical protein